jgi:UDP-N-acetylmuramyl pentapeptide phosphotransferase/UDP-N-acetylglucosamine-1-phosphate transferase
MPVTIWLLARYKIHDVPNERSSHQRATIRGTGLAIVLGCFGGFIINWESSYSVLLLILVSVWFGSIGFIDDVRSLSAKIRLSAQLVGSLLPLFILSFIHTYQFSLLLVLCGSFGVIAYVNAFNFMDGINYISVMQTVVVAVSLVIAGNVLQIPLITIGASSVLGAVLGFLPFNGIIAKTFMGDIGSYFLGAWLSILAFIAFQNGSGLVFAISLGAIYFSDTGTTLARRVIRKEKWMAAHRQHEFQKMIDMGYSHFFVSIYVSFFSALSCLSGLFSLRSSAVGSLFSLSALVPISVIYLNGHRYHFLRRWTKWTCPDPLK